MQNDNYSWDAIDEAAMVEGLATRYHRHMVIETREAIYGTRNARPITKGDCKRRGMVRGCQAAKNRMGTISVSPHQLTGTGSMIERVRLAGLRRQG
jgi:hypothetical protein